MRLDLHTLSEVYKSSWEGKEKVEDSLKHIPRDGRNPTNRRLSGLSRRLLQSCLDRVDWRIGERPHSAGHETDDGRLVGRDWRVGVLGLPFLEHLFKFRVRREIHCLVGS